MTIKIKIHKYYKYYQLARVLKIMILKKSFRIPSLRTNSAWSGFNTVFLSTHTTLPSEKYI